jgi:uncharacterized membrane protein YagU involved in acid resistance
MPRQRSSPRKRKHDLAVSVIGGIAGGLVASFAMERFERALGRLSPEVGGVPGAGGQQYRRPQSEPATFQAADVLADHVTGQPLPGTSKPAVASALHYAFGGAVGAIYGEAAVRTPDIATGAGLPFGATVWLLADELGMPLAGLARKPAAYPIEDHATTLAAHLIYGAVTEGVRRTVIATLRR